MRERTVEQRLVRLVTVTGAFTCKFTSAIDGVPDRIVIHNHRVWFVEVKRPGEEPTKLQRYMMRRMARSGALVRVVAGYKQIDAFVAEMVA
jgi:hypothetical protein